MAPAPSRIRCAIQTAEVLQEGISIPAGPITVPRSKPPAFEITARGAGWMEAGQGMGVSSGRPFSHQTAASASLKTEPGGAYRLIPSGASSAVPEAA
jgi:hypothetical protein